MVMAGSERNAGRPPHWLAGGVRLRAARITAWSYGSCCRRYPELPGEIAQDCKERGLCPCRKTIKILVSGCVRWRRPKQSRSPRRQVPRPPRQPLRPGKHPRPPPRRRVPGPPWVRAGRVSSPASSSAWPSPDPDSTAVITEHHEVFGFASFPQSHVGNTQRPISGWRWGVARYPGCTSATEQSLRHRVSPRKRFERQEQADATVVAGRGITMEVPADSEGCMGKDSMLTPNCEGAVSEPDRRPMPEI